jgi:hypothetical protein
LVIVFMVAILMSLVGAAASLFRGPRYIHAEPGADTMPADVGDVASPIHVGRDGSTGRDQPVDLGHAERHSSAACTAGQQRVGDPQRLGNRRLEDVQIAFTCDTRSRCPTPADA